MKELIRWLYLSQLELIDFMTNLQRHSPKGVLRNFAKFTGKHLCQSLFFNKVKVMSATLLKKILWNRCFPVSLAKFLRTPFLTEHLRLLNLSGINDKICLQIHSASSLYNMAIRSVIEMMMLFWFSLHCWRFIQGERLLKTVCTIIFVFSIM